VASLAGGGVRCGCVFSEPIRAPIRAAWISDRETVKPTWSDAAPAALRYRFRCCCGVVPIFPLEGERERSAHPQRTISARTRYRY